MERSAAGQATGPLAPTPDPRAPGAPERHAHLPALLAILALGLFLFREVLFGAGALYERDIYLYWYAQVEAIVRSVAAGSWPLWDPLASFGEPIWEVPAPNAVAYRTTWLNLILPRGRSTA